MSCRYDEFKGQERQAQAALAMAALAVGGASAFVGVVTTARIAINPLSPFNFLRAPVVLGAAGVTALSVFAVKRLLDCNKGNTPCP